MVGCIMRKLRGFTLIELLVVIAIIALLMGILMPALSRVKKQARSAACKALLKQWGIIWSMYCDDNNGRFPEAGDLGWKRGTWVIAFRPIYRTRTKILLCPSANKRRASAGGSIMDWGDSTHAYVQGTGGYDNRTEECSYGGNNWTYYATGIPVFADTMWRGGGPCYRTSESAAPSKSFNRIAPPAYDGQWVDYNNEMKHFALSRHQTGTNMLFMDWSVRDVGLKELWTLKWHRQYPVNGPWTKGGGVQPGDWPEWMRNFKEY
jgi:prepilin-type N-terminal cleavage/methylation domain-containing protein/prepilin-type processing-associated H-X9-DG protein